MIDLPPRARSSRSPASAGDEVVFTKPLRTPQDEPTGTLHSVCTVTQPHGGIETSRFQCSGTYILRDGTLAIDFAGALAGDTTTLAVTGGTGAYAGARGTARSVTRAGGETADDTIELLSP